MRLLIQDRAGNPLVIAMGDIAPTVACFLAGALFGALLMRLATA